MRCMVALHVAELLGAAPLSLSLSLSLSQSLRSN
jgi:hypothetical protein